MLNHRNVLFTIRAWTCFLVLTLLSCTSADDDTSSSGGGSRLGTVTQALDSDSDGLDDSWETTNFGNLSQTASGDSDSDGMTNLEEYQNSFN